jgi:hypothetical protein
MKTERKELEIVNVIVYAAICLVILQYLTGCTGFKMCASLNQIDEISDTQKLNKKPGQ